MQYLLTGFLLLFIIIYLRKEKKGEKRDVLKALDY